jgi:integrase
MASVYKRKLTSSTVWFGAVRLKDGRWKKYSTGLDGAEHSKREALAHANAVQTEIDAGRDPFKERVESSQSVPDMALKFLASKSGHVRPKTLEAYRDSTKWLIKSCGSISARNLGRVEIERFKESLSHMKPDSQNHYLSSVRVFLNWMAVELDGYKPPKVKLERGESAHRDYYTVDECQRLLAAANGVTISGVSFRSFLLVLLSTGMRLGEVIMMQRSWLSGNRILIPPEATKTHHKRVVPVNAELSLLIGSMNDQSFPWSAGSGYLREVWASVVKRAGVRYLKIHNLRDTYVVHQLLAGVAPLIVAKTVGNSVKVIEEHYSDIAGEELEVALERGSGFSTNLFTSLCN